MAYKKRVVKPALRLAQKVQSFQQFESVDSVQVTQHTALTRDIVQASPFRERLENLWNRTQKAADRAEKAVRVVKDQESGELVPVGPDVSAIAPILNQAHKNVELLGRVTGELQENTGRANVAIQIVIPNAAERNPGPVIEAEPVEVRLFKR